ELDERVDEARARLRREHVVVVRGGVEVEECDLLLLVLRLILHQGSHFRIGSDLVMPGLDPGIPKKASHEEDGLPGQARQWRCERQESLAHALAENLRPAATSSCGAWSATSCWELTVAHSMLG